MENLTLRFASAFDCEILFTWKNDCAVQESAFNSAPVAHEEHEKWFASTLQNPDIRIFILESDSVPVGQVRLNRDGNTGIIDYSIDENYRGKGLGKKIIVLAEDAMKKAGFVSSLKAEVKKDNVPSQKVFERLGYSKSETENCFSYTKNLPIIIIISNKEWHEKYVAEVASRTGFEVVYIDDREKVSKAYLGQYNPRYIFFPHWSYIIPAEVYDSFECVIFHMTDLPFGRGGSPLQNLIERGIYETKLSALRCSKELDGGDIYLKRLLSLWGSAEEIYLRAAELTKEMMIEIAKGNAVPIPQEGEPVCFKRRTPEQGDISKCDNLESVFDYIRMLDADGYPHAFLDTEHLHFEFERASLKDGFIKADVKISLKEVQK